jgi:hypothetical protein
MRLLLLSGFWLFELVLVVLVALVVLVPAVAVSSALAAPGTYGRRPAAACAWERCCAGACGDLSGLKGIA